MKYVYLLFLYFQFLTHAWDQPHNDCLGAGCTFCTGSKFNPSLNGDSVSIGGDSLNVGRNGGCGGGSNQWQGYHTTGQSYWRFKVDDAFFRVMVLDKEKAGVGARYELGHRSIKFFWEHGIQN